MSIVYFRTERDLKIGDRVKPMRGGRRTGIVKFIGNTEFAKGEVIGLALDVSHDAGLNGSIRVVKYFECEDGHESYDLNPLYW